ncbi:DUF6377 domain-containing protein [Flavobacterium sp. 3HN19-14]|uniref:DUF6377 domain-containing protein n=1 Tax=Flavobacterium sp. 3HN19-14 TaxID=3448133 RepID=UPI003EE39B86
MLGNTHAQKDIFSINENLYQEYRKFKIDSAMYYINLNLKIADELSDQEMKISSEIKLANLYSSTGNFKESESILKNINSSKLSVLLKALYYEFYSQYYEHYATNSYNDYYIRQIETYRDSLLSVLNPDTPKFKINLAQKNLYQKKYSAAKESLLNMMRTAKNKDADYAMYVYLLGDIYDAEHDRTQMLSYYSKAAVTDIENAIKDNAAIQKVAIECYKDGDIERAYKYTQSALEDAIFCNVKFRTLNMSEFYSIINTAYLKKESESKNQLESYLILVSILTILLIIAVVYVYKQMKKVSRIKERLAQSSNELGQLNTEMAEANSQLLLANSELSESNLVKEEYIARFFDICSSYIDKIESYRKMLHRKLQDKKYDELQKILKSTTITDNELEEFYKNFDTIFINLFPNFVEDFNALLNKDEQVIPKNDEILNTELRIFALVRLGITDSAKIAALLRYSLSTIYNYRTKARNRAAGSRDEFENLVAKIGTAQTQP